MSRELVREMKRSLRSGKGAHVDDGQRQRARDAALALLVRSVGMGHRRLAVQRLHDAVSFGVQVSGEQWAYCRQAAMASGDMRVRALFTRSEEFLRADQASQLKGPRHG